MPDWLDDFDGPALGAAWVDSYLPAWSSRAASRAHWRLADSALRLSVPADHPVWCADRHSPPIRVSGVQSGNFSGPVGSTRGQQPFRAGLSVAEEQHEHWGWTPHGGEVTVRARMGLGPRSMASAWLIGRELNPAESAEICVMEIFGREYGADGAVQVGMGLHAFRDPRVTEDFHKLELALDPAQWHDYRIHWSADAVRFSIDGTDLLTCADPPLYPMQLELAVFDFPQWSTGTDDDHEPWLEVDNRAAGVASKPRRPDDDHVPWLEVDRVWGSPPREN